MEASQLYRTMGVGWGGGGRGGDGVDKSFKWDTRSGSPLKNLGARCSSVVRAFAHGAMGRRGSILHGVDPLRYFSFQPVIHDWCNKGRGMCYPVCGMTHIKEPLLLIGKSSPCSGGSGFPLSRYLSGPLPYA